MGCSDPVSPLLVLPIVALPGTPDGDEIVVDDESDIGVDPTELSLDDPIVGERPVEKRKTPLNPHVGMPRIRGLPTPKAMSAAQRAEHMIGHLPI